VRKCIGEWYHTSRVLWEFERPADGSCVWLCPLGWVGLRVCGVVWFGGVSSVAQMGLDVL
jgi:hypothetical protein